jgi:hypothetical protein
MRLRSVATGHCRTYGLLTHCEKPVACTLLSYCEPYNLALHHLGFRDSRDEIDTVGQGNYHGDRAASLLEVLDPNQNVVCRVGMGLFVLYLYMIA